MSEEIFINEIKDENSFNNNNEVENKNSFYKIPEKFRKYTINFQEYEENDVKTFGNENNNNDGVINISDVVEQKNNEHSEEDLRKTLKNEAHEKFPIEKEMEQKMKNKIYKQRSKYINDELIKRKLNKSENHVENVIKNNNNNVSEEYHTLPKTNEEIKNENIQKQVEVSKDELCNTIRQYQLYARLYQTTFVELMKMERGDLEKMIEKLKPLANKALLECANGPVLMFTLFCFKLIETQADSIKYQTSINLDGCYNTAVSHQKTLGEKLAGLLEEFPELTSYLISNRYAFLLECGGILAETHFKNTMLDENKKEKLVSLNTNIDLAEPKIKKRKN